MTKPTENSIALREVLKNIIMEIFLTKQPFIIMSFYRDLHRTSFYFTIFIPAIKMKTT